MSQFARINRVPADKMKPSGERRLAAGSAGFRILAAWSGRMFAICAAAVLAGCADRQASIDAATRLAEATYPGQLEVTDAQLQKTHYDVIFAVKGDPFTRIRLQMDRDPALCRARTECQRRLRRAYVEGRHRGGQLKAMNEAFRQCRVPLLATRSLGAGTAYVVELDLGLTDQQAALDRLASCTRTFTQIYGEPIAHNFLIVRARDGRPTAIPNLVTLETRLPQARQHEPAYWVHVELGRVDITQNLLRIDRNALSKGPVHERLVAAAEALLKERKPGAVMRWPHIVWNIALDPRRIDIARAYLMACSEEREGPCLEDLAIRVTYDFTANKLQEMTLLDAPQGLKGMPDLPGRSRQEGKIEMEGR